MKKLILVLLMVALPLFASAGTVNYLEGTTIGVPINAPSDDGHQTGLPLIFINTYTGAGVSTWPMGTWANVDLSAYNLPAGVKAVHMSGILIITHGSNVEDCNLTVAVRSGADTTFSYPYTMQTIEPITTGGERSTAGVWVALNNGSFQMNWSGLPQSAPWPTGCSYGVNLHLDAYIR